MKFKCNGSEWDIEEIEKDKMQIESGNDYTMGLTIYIPQKVYLLKGQANILKTLKHELMHVWMYEYGHNQDSKYDNEDICEMVSSSNNFINDIVEEFCKNGK